MNTAQINCNCQETGCYARDLPDIDAVNELGGDKHPISNPQAKGGEE